MSEVLTKFDANAFVAPKTKEDVIAFLEECIREMEYFNELLRAAFGDVR